MQPSYINAENISIDRSIFQELGNEKLDSPIISVISSNVEFSNSVLYNNTGFRIGRASAEEDVILHSVIYWYSITI